MLPSPTSSSTTSPDFFLLGHGLVAAHAAGRSAPGRRLLQLAFALLNAPGHAASLGVFPWLLSLPQGTPAVSCARASALATSPVPSGQCGLTVAGGQTRAFYISTALGVTFPFNIIVGIPLSWP